MAPVRFATACAGCHSLAFDKRIDEPVPHDKPEVVRAFVVKKLNEYIASHPTEVRVVRDPSRDLTGKPLQPEVRILTPSQWVAERTADAEELLWRKTCKQCHALQCVAGSDLPSVAPGQSDPAMVAPREIRSRRASRIYLRRLPFPSSQRAKIQRYTGSRHRQLPDLPCAGPRTRGISLLRMPHLS